MYQDSEISDFDFVDILNKVYLIAVKDAFPIIFEPIRDILIPGLYEQLKYHNRDIKLATRLTFLYQNGVQEHSRDAHMYAMRQMLNYVKESNTHERFNRLFKFNGENNVFESDSIIHC